MSEDAWRHATEFLKGGTVARFRTELPNLEQFLRRHCWYGQQLLQHADRAIILYNQLRREEQGRKFSTAWLDGAGVWRADQFVADRLFVRSELSPQVKFWRMDEEEMARTFRSPEQGGLRIYCYGPDGVIGMIRSSLDEIAQEVLARIPTTLLPSLEE